MTRAKPDAKLKGLKELREGRHMTQSEVARQIGTSTSHYNRIENGYVWPERDTLEKIAALFEVGVEELITGRLKESRLSPNIEREQGRSTTSEGVFFPLTGNYEKYETSYIAARSGKRWEPEELRKESPPDRLTILIAIEDANVAKKRNRMNYEEEYAKKIKEELPERQPSD
jgi:transcriptional regulator with XRE-family HTH domain